MSRSRKLGGGGGHGDGDDLMITPLLDLFVAMIPFLIISMVMTKINVVDVGVSKPVKTATLPQKNDKPFDLLLKVQEKKIDVVLNGKIVKSVSRENVAPEQWISAVRVALIEVKRQYPEQYKLKVEPEGKTNLQSLMGLMDGARKLKPEDGEILGKDENGKPVKLQFLFPNVILRGIYG